MEAGKQHDKAGQVKRSRWLAPPCTLKNVSPRMDLSTPLNYVKGVGPARAAMFEAKGLATVEDLLGYVPFRYEDRSNMKTIAQLPDGRGGFARTRGERQAVSSTGTIH